MLAWLRPRDHLGEAELRRGLALLAYEGVFGQVMATLVSGAFLVAFALELGASNKVIGLLAAIAPLGQILQLPSIFLIDWLRIRKALAVPLAAASRVIWLAIAALPWLAPAGARLPCLLAGLAGSAALGNISAAAWNPWMRDLVPDGAMSGVFARRLALATAASAAAGLAAGLAVDAFAGRPAGPVAVYSGIFVAGTLAGLAGVYCLARIPEPAMPPVRARPIRDILGAPLRDREFRELIRFLYVWNFAVNLAAPFVTVYLLRRLGYSLATVVAFAVASQLANALSLRLWGRLADRFTHKSVLGGTGGLFLATLLLWPAAGMVHRDALALALVTLIHLVGGVATAGVTLCSSTIALKAAPRGEATPYLATNALLSGIAATLAPLAGGIAADCLAGSRLSLDLRWASTLAGDGGRVLSAITLEGLDFVFVFAAGVGLYAMHRLLAVREHGEVEPGVVLYEFYAEVWRTVRGISTISGLRRLTAFPYAVLLTLAPERRRKPRPRGAAPLRRESSPAPAPGSRDGAGSAPSP